MAAPSPSRLFAAGRVEPLSFFCGALFLWPLWVAIYFHRRPILRHHKRYCRKISQMQCNNTYNSATDYVDTAIWLGS